MTTDRVSNVRVLVCGDRNWTDGAGVRFVLNRLRRDTDGVLTVIEGGARGADRFAQEWAEEDRTDVVLLTFPADWSKYGKGAGAIRNQQMLDEGKPDVVMAFHNDIVNSKGTRDMVRRAEKAGIKTTVLYSRPGVLRGFTRVTQVTP